MRTVTVNGTRLQLHERGRGMPVVLCHGFPGLGISYRHQMRAIEQAGFRAVALDMLGYGGSDAPDDPAAYVYSRITRDLVALLDLLEASKAIFVGHDFGAPAAWNVAIRASERVAGLVLLGVPYDPDRMATRPSEIYAAMAKKHFLHIDYFQAQGVAERELDPRAAEFLRKIFWALSGGYRYLDIWKHPSEGNGYLDVLPETPTLPWSWLDASTLEQYAEVFARTGFRGGLNWYRAFDANWALGEHVAGATIEAPTLFVAGESDPVIAMRGPAAIERMRQFIPQLRGVHLLPKIGHFVQQEAPSDVNALLVEFLHSIA